MVTIIFEPHATSKDNEAHRSSGWNDVDLSELGAEQAEGLGERHEDENFDAVFSSDLIRAYKTAKIAFGDRLPIIKDKRLRECNYGDLTCHPSEEIEKEKSKRIGKPFPNGESYEQASERMRDFLSDLFKDYNGKKVMIVGHRATQYGLEHWILGKTLEATITAPWKWQPGWTYNLEKI